MGGRQRAFGQASGAAWALLSGCAAAVVNPPPPPALVVHNGTGDQLVIEARPCGQPEGPPIHSYPVAAGRSERFEPGPECLDFVALQGSRVVGKQGEVTLRHEMDWAIGR